MITVTIHDPEHVQVLEDDALRWFGDVEGRCSSVAREICGRITKTRGQQFDEERLERFSKWIDMKLDGFEDLTRIMPEDVKIQFDRWERAIRERKGLYEITQAFEGWRRWAWSITHAADSELVIRRYEQFKVQRKRQTMNRGAA